MKLFLFLGIVAMTWFHSADSAGMTKATDKQRKDINVLIAMWQFDSVIKNSNIKTLYPSHPPFMGRESKQPYRLDEERPAGDFNKYRIQSGSDTFADVLIKQNVVFGKRKIRKAFVDSTKSGKIVKLDGKVKMYTSYVAEDEVEEIADNVHVEIPDENMQGQPGAPGLE